ncbi:MAG: ABC transporter permease, partial [Bacteroidetes bacterium]|nr:ABC transporter permease [Bacteroidota bacterium]
EDHFYLADASFFDVFTFPLRRGDPETALAVPGTVILTETTARRYFGDTDPLGQIINYENSIDLTVVGVVDDVPSNSHLQFDFLMTLETPGVAGDGWLENWDRSATMIYVLLRPNAPPDALEAKLPRFVDAYLKDTLDEHEVYTLSLHALTDIHLYPHRAPEQVWAAGNLKYVYIFSIIGLLMMFIACINYVNLATARAMGRAREVGVRKVLGSHRSQLIGQFIGESSLLAGAALLTAVLLVALCLPAVNTLSGKAFSTAHLGEPVILLGLLGMWAFVGLAAGSYPAFYLSAFRPAVVIRGGFAGGSRGRTALRNGLVVVQFAAAILLIVGTMVVSDQLAFMRHKDLGYDKEHIVVVPIRDQVAWQGAPALKDELLKISGYSPDRQANIARAKELLAEAGFPNGFEVRGKLFVLSGVPEQPELMEAAAGFWEAIGLKPKLEEIEFSRWRENYRGLETQCCVYPFRGPAAPIATRVHFYFSPERFFRSPATDGITENKNKALETQDPAEAARLWKAVADELYFDVHTMPLFTLPVQAIIDPEVISEYVFLGPPGGSYNNFENIKGVRK